MGLHNVVSKGKENPLWQVQKMLLWTLPDPMLPPQQQHCIVGGNR
jgi:hypothetical protein